MTGAQTQPGKMTSIDELLAVGYRGSTYFCNCPAWMPSSALRQDQNQSNDDYGDDGRGNGRLNANPPSWIGLSSKSPTVAPSGRVRMKAAQNSSTRDTSVQK